MATVVNPFGTKGPVKAKTTTKVTPKYIAKPTAPSTQTLNVYGSPSTNTRPVTSTKPKTGGTSSRDSEFKKELENLKKLGAEAKKLAGLVGGADTGGTTTTTKTIISRTPRYDSKGKLIGYDLVYSDGTTDFEPNPAYGQEEEEVKGTTDIQVIKALLQSKGFPSSLIDSSVTFLTELLKDGLSEDSALEIYLNTKSYTTKKGTALTSPFYSAYGFYNDALPDRDKYGASDLFNAVEGYRGVQAKYNVSEKFISQDSITKYLKNKISPAILDTNANTARLLAINADPNRILTLQKLGFINSSQDLTDFYMDPTIGIEKMQQNVNTAAFALEAVSRANAGIAFDKTTAEKYGAKFTAQGLDESMVTGVAAKGFETIGQYLGPTIGLSNVYTPNAGVTPEIIQQELQQEQFDALGLSAEERRNRLKLLAAASFSGKAGVAEAGLSTQYLGKSSSAGQF